MAKWKKGFRSVPAAVWAKIKSIEEENVRVSAGKEISKGDVADGVYSHLGLTLREFYEGANWQVTPPEHVGTTSRRNVEGWSELRKDLPKFKKYFYHDIQNFGDGSKYGWSTVAIPREVYEKDEIPPYMFNVNVEVMKFVSEDVAGVVFSVDEIFAKDSPTFETDILFAINLLQENVGATGVLGSTEPVEPFSASLSWDFFPPGDADRLVDAIASRSKGSDVDREVVRERLELFEEFEPIRYLKGLGGSDHYIGAQYADDLVAFENMKKGNALYVLYGDWKETSKKPRSEILRMSSKNFDRIVHTEGWQGRFAVLMQRELRERGVKIRIGRNRRRRH